MSKLTLPVDWKLPEVILRRIGDTAGRQRAMVADDHLLLVLHEPPTVGDHDRVGRLFWRDAHGNWRAKPFGDGVQALKRHVAEFDERVDRLESLAQSADTADEHYALLREIAPLHRTIRHLLSTLQEARDLVPQDRDLINLRDKVVEIDRAVELLHGDARNGLDHRVAKQAEDQSKRMYDMAVSAHRLNVLAAVFFPIATLSAVFGMNLVHGLEGGTTTIAFWAVVLVGLACGLVLAQLINVKPPLARRGGESHTRGHGGASG